MNSELVKFLTRLSFSLGLNTAHDWDGIETLEDVEIYKEAVFRKIQHLRQQTLQPRLITAEERLKSLNSLVEKLLSESFSDQYSIADFIEDNPQLAKRMEILATESSLYQKIQELCLKETRRQH